MGYRVGHPPLTAAGRGWLVVLADPRGTAQPPQRRNSRATPLSPDQFEALLAAAAAHGVLPAAARYLRSLTAAPGTIIAGAGAAQLLDRKLADIETKLVVLSGQNLLLAHHAGRIMQALAAAKLAAAVIKGPVFARRLYAPAADRSFTDIDILLAPATLGATGEVLRGLGFVPAVHDNPDAGAGIEFQWLAADNRSLLVELQSDLVHSHRLGRGVRFGLAELVEAGGGNPEDPNALLMVAAIHGAAGHQFERLQPVVDVLQAARGAAGAIDYARLRRSAAATGTTVALQAALDLAARLFHDGDARAAADQLRPARWRRLRRALLAPAVVLNAQSAAAGRNSWRRRALREIILHSGRNETARGT